jgi:hypothetical protein
VTNLSTPLEDAGDEARKFAEFFDADVLVDSDELYYIRMVRK